MTDSVEDVIRASDVFDIPLGAVLEGDDGRYIFVGWAANTVGHQAALVQDMTDVGWGYQCIRTYTCAYAETLARKFPGVTRYRIY